MAEEKELPTPPPQQVTGSSVVHADGQYPLLDIDPHFARVVSYFRTSDYAVWAGLTAGIPGLLYDLSDPVKAPVGQAQRAFALRFYGPGVIIGFCGGFLKAYQRSSARFWGWDENEREQVMQDEEFTQLARQGKPIWGESDQPEWIQKSAYHNSRYSQLKFNAIPWFNFVHHPYHGIDVSKYVEAGKAWREENGLSS